MPMKPDEILKWLFEDNRAFRDDRSSDFFRPYADNQNPVVTLVSCSDSRVQTHAISGNPFDRIFVIRNIGNQLATCYGSVDYGVLHLKTPVLLILGHSDCGAVKAAMTDYSGESVDVRKELDSLPEQKAVDAGDNDYRSTLLENIMDNIHFQVESAVKRYRSSIGNKQLVVIGAFYDFRNDLGQGAGVMIMVNRNGQRLSL